MALIRMRGVACLLIIIFLIFPLPRSMGEESGTDPFEENSNITGTVEIEDMNFTHNGSIVIKSGGTLILRNVEMYILHVPIQGLYYYRSKVLVEGGGRLEMYNSRIASVPGAERDDMIFVNIEGEAKIEDSEFFHLGADHRVGHISEVPSGIQIYSDDVLIQRTKIHHNRGQGIYMEDCSPTIVDCLIYNNEGVGILAHGSGPVVDGALILENEFGGIELYDHTTSVASIKNCEIRSCGGSGVSSWRSKVSVEDCRIEDVGSDGIDIFDIDASSMKIRGNTIKGISRGVTLYAVSSFSVESNIFENNNVHIHLQSGNGTTRGNSYGSASQYVFNISGTDVTIFDGPIDYKRYEVKDSSGDIKIKRPLDVILKDGNGIPIPDALIEVTNGTGAIVFSGRSVSNGTLQGEFLLAEWNPLGFKIDEPYRLTATKGGIGKVYDLDLAETTGIELTLEPLSDLSIVNITIKPVEGSGEGSEEMQISVSIANEGMAVSPVTQLLVTIEDERLDEVDIPSLATNEQHDAILRWDVAEPGSYEIGISVDPDSDIPELTEATNHLEKNVDVLPDLVLKNSDIAFEPQNATEGSKVSMIMTLTNEGLWGGGPVITTLKVNGNTEDEMTFTYIGPGESIPLEFEIEATGGEMSVEVHTRFEGRGDELDLSDNQASANYQSTRIEEQFSWGLVYGIIIIAVCLVVGLVAFYLITRRRRKKEQVTHEESLKFGVDTFVEYRKGKLFYSFILKNQTPHPISDIQIRPALPAGTFKPDKDAKSLTMLDIGATQTVRFELHPLGECGTREVWATVDFYDFEIKGRRSMQTKRTVAEVVCPVIHTEHVDIRSFDSLVYSMRVAEEVADQIPVPASQLFEVVTSVLRGKNMTPLQPNVNDTGVVFHGVGRFWASGVKGFKYAVVVEVVGGAQMSKLILRVYSSSDKALVGFMQAIIDSIQPKLPVREHVKPKFLLEVVDGDLVGGRTTSIHGSVVQRSHIGGGAR